MIKIIYNNDEKNKKFILECLQNNNDKNCKWLRDNRSKRFDYNFFAYDNEKLIGGAIGFVEYNWYFLDLLYVDENYRHKQIGSQLIAKIEEFAKKQTLIGVRMETWDFQAKSFYEKCGYKVFAVLKDCPPNTIVYFFKKIL